MIVNINKNKLVFIETIDQYQEQPMSIKKIFNNLLVVKSKQSIQLLDNHTLIPVIKLKDDCQM